MLTRALVGMLKHANSPMAVKAITTALTATTGVSNDVVTDWYQRNGFYRLQAMYGGSESYSGKHIDAESALESTAIYAGVKMIAEDVGSLPFFTYRRSADRKSTEKAYDHPLYRTLHDLVNPDISASEFVEALTAHALLGLDGFARIDRMDSGIFLWPWNPVNVRVEWNRYRQPVFIYKEGNAAEKTYQRDEVFHLKGFTLTGLRGDNVLQRARHAIGLTLATEEYASRYFAQDATPGLVLERPTGIPTLSPEGIQTLKAAWVKWYRGLKHKWEPAVVQEGVKVNVLTPKAAESQIVEQRKFQVLEVCRLLRLPPHKLADTDRQAYASIEAENIEYVGRTLSPWVRRWRDAVYRCLLTFDEQRAGNVWAEHSVEAMQRGDFATQSEGFRKMLEKGVYSINDVRRMLNLNLIPGGDEHFIQLNLSTVQSIAEGLNLPEKQPSTLRPVNSQPAQ